MAEIPMNGQGGSPAQERNLATITNYAGAALSLALIVGVGVWGYKILARDVSGVPVVRAATGEPMRVAPNDPGGLNAAHQGLSVNKVMAEGGAEKPSDRLVLAPKPVTLTEEDAPMASIESAEPVSALEAADGAGADDASETVSAQMASIQALAEELAGGARPLGDVPEPTAAAVPAPEAKTDTDESASIAAAASSEEQSETVAADQPNDFGRSLRPVLRPASFTQQTASVTAAGETAPGETEPVTVPAGTRLVQLGAFDDAEVARREWTRLSDRFDEYMDGKTSVVQRAKSGGRVFYRLRAMGFADLSDARRFCAALVAEKADCIPVVAK